jgi:hypothetical protein
MKVRSATPNDVSLIVSFIQKKSEFDQNIGAFSSVLQVSARDAVDVVNARTRFALEWCGHQRSQQWHATNDLRHGRNLKFRQPTVYSNQFVIRRRN